MAAADPQKSNSLPDLDNTIEAPAVNDAPSDLQDEDDIYDNDDRGLDSSHHTASMRDKEKKIGHRRVDKAGIVSYKKKPTSELMAAIQLGIGQSVGGLSSKPERDVLMQDFGVVEVVFFPSEGSNLTPAHHYSDFRFKTYAPVAFRYFRDLFGIQPDDFMLSLCDAHLKELSNPGASGSIFYLTQDDEFIIKTVQHKEADFLQKLLPGYFLNISQNKRTLLPKFYGLYCYQCGGKNIRFTVMNNLLPSTVKLHEKYDMKGSTYKRKASKHERSKSSPTLKDLDFMENHPEGLHLEKETYEALIKTLQRDCRVLESFKIMDYSLLVGIYNLDQANKEKAMQQSTTSESSHGATQEKEAVPASTQLSRGKSFKARIGQYSTPMESIQGNTELLEEEEEDVPPGGIPARNAKGERLLLYLGIIDILQSFRLKKRLEHTVKSMVIDGDTISVHRPSYYAQRFLQYHAQRVFKKAPTALKHSPSKKRSMMNKTRGQTMISDQQSGTESSGSHPRVERTSRTISFSDEQPALGPGAVGGKPDLLPEYSRVGERNQGLTQHTTPSPRAMRADYNQNGSSRLQKRSDYMTTYPSEDALSAGTASTASLRNVGLGYPVGGPRGPSPPLSLSESTPTHTDYTEGTPSFTNSSPSCSSDVMGYNNSASSSANITSCHANTATTYSQCHNSSTFKFNLPDATKVKSTPTVSTTITNLPNIVPIPILKHSRNQDLGERTGQSKQQHQQQQDLKDNVESIHHHTEQQPLSPPPKLKDLSHHPHHQTQLKEFFPTDFQTAHQESVDQSQHCHNETEQQLPHTNSESTQPSHSQITTTTLPDPVVKSFRPETILEAEELNSNLSGLQYIAGSSAQLDSPQHYPDLATGPPVYQRSPETGHRGNQRLSAGQGSRGGATSPVSPLATPVKVKVTPESPPPEATGGESLSSSSSGTLTSTTTSTLTAIAVGVNTVQKNGSVTIATASTSKSVSSAQPGGDSGAIGNEGLKTAEETEMDLLTVP